MTPIEIFNNREIALAIWIFGIFAWALTMPKFRGAMGAFSRHSGKKAILVALGLMVAYIGSVVWLLNEASFWHIGQLKNTVIWAASVAAVLLIRLASRSEDRDFFKQIIRDNLKLIVVLEFIVSFHTFSLLTELLLLPIVALIAGMLVIAESDAKHKAVEQILNFILVGVGVLLIGNALFDLISDFSAFSTQETLADFSLPPILSFLFLPFLYVADLYLSYEQSFVKVALFIDDNRLRTYAKVKAILHYGLEITLLTRWAKRLAFVRPKSRKDIDDSIKQVFAMRKVEKNPPEVDIAVGWSPYAAKEFLTSEGLHTGYYEPANGENWHASSPYKELKGDILPNNIAYYVDGDGKDAKTLRLVLNVNDRDTAQAAQSELLDRARDISMMALRTSLPTDVERAISSGKDLKVNIEDVVIDVKKDNWPSHARGGYSMEFTVRKPK